MNKPWLQQLVKLFAKDQIHTQIENCWTYGYDNSREHHCPDAVVFADNEQQIQTLVRFCNEHHVSLTPRGRGTGTAGAAVPVKGGIVLSCERMQQISEIDIANRSVQVQPGVTNGALQRHAQACKLFWPPDPSSSEYCSIGGNLAVNAAGPRAIKYGTCRDNTLGLRAVLGDGNIIQTGSMTHKSNVGYDLTRLLIGSQGTLGIITEATLKLAPLAQARAVLQASYSDITSCVEAMVTVMASGILPEKLEFMDSQALALIRHATPQLADANSQAMLLIEVADLSDVVRTKLDIVAQHAKNQGLITQKYAWDTQSIQNLWAARKALSPALRQLAPKKINEDVVVPISELPALLRKLEELRQTHDLTIVSFGHAGSGNLHVNIMLDPDDARQTQAASHCLEQLFNTVLQLNGSLSGEHGMGLVKRDFIQQELCPNTLALMHKIKQSFDPNGILNPGKLPT